MSVNPPEPSDYALAGVRTPQRVCKLVAPGIANMVRAAFAQYGQVDPEVVAWARAVEIAAARDVGCESASTPTRRSVYDATGAGEVSPTGAKFPHDLHTTTEAAAVVGCSSSAIRAAVASGRLQPARRGPYMFARTEVARFAQSRKIPA